MGKMKWGILFFGYMLLCSYDDVMALIVLKCFYVFKDSECVNSIINVFFYKSSNNSNLQSRCRYANWEKLNDFVDGGEGMS